MHPVEVEGVYKRTIIARLELVVYATALLTSTWVEEKL